MQITDKELLLIAMALDDVTGTPGYRGEITAQLLADLRKKLADEHWQRATKSKPDAV